MSTIKSSSEHLTLNADGASKDIKFQANGVEKASISSAGAFTSTTIDATKLTGNLPAIDGSSLTGVGGIMQTPYFAAKVSSNQSIAHNVMTKVNFDSEILDSDSCYDTTNKRFTPTTAGNYLVYVETNIHDLTDGYYMVSAAYKNGSPALRSQSGGGIDQNVAQSCFGVINMNGSSDYIEGYVKIHNNAGDRNLLANGSTATPHFMAWRIG